MKKLNIPKISLIIILLLLSIQPVKSLGISTPMPYGLNVLRGENARFIFEIMGQTSADKLKCTYTVSGMDPLSIIFDEKEVVVDAGGSKGVLGTVSVPANAPIKTYNGNLVANCAPYVDTSKDFSGSVVHQSMNVGFVIEVVETKEETSVGIIAEKEKPKASPIILVLIIIVLILSIVGFYFSRKKKTE